MRLSSLVFTDPDCTIHILPAAACNTRWDHKQCNRQVANTIFNILLHISSVSLCWVTGEGAAGLRLPPYSLTYATSITQPLAGQPAPLPRQDEKHNAGTSADQTTHPKASISHGFPDRTHTMSRTVAHNSRSMSAASARAILGIARCQLTPAAASLRQLLLTPLHSFLQVKIKTPLLWFLSRRLIYWQGRGLVLVVPPY